MHITGWKLRRQTVRRLAITSVTLQHPDFPTQNWVSLPNNKTIDGNPVRITMRVQNNGTSFVTRQVRITETEFGECSCAKGY